MIPVWKSIETDKPPALERVFAAGWSILCLCKTASGFHRYGVMRVTAHEDYDVGTWQLYDPGHRVTNLHTDVLEWRELEADEAEAVHAILHWLAK